MTIALLGASANPQRAAHYVMAFLQEKGHRVIPVNPGLAGQTLLGETVYARLGDVPEKIDMVDVFRASEYLDGIVAECIEAGVPAMGTELDEHTIPAEAGVVERSVSFTKGCYVGQENTARMHHRDKVNRKLVVEPVSPANEEARAVYPELGLAVRVARVGS